LNGTTAEGGANESERREYDLFLPLPPQFDLAVMDRFARYLPGWEMPKNSDAFLTGRYGLITDHLAEAFHYQLKHSNRYEELYYAISNPEIRRQFLKMTKSVAEATGPL
jgi:predicted ATP-dependent Lon-type protease